MTWRRALRTTIGLVGLVLATLALVVLIGGWRSYGRVTQPQLLEEYTRIERDCGIIEPPNDHLGLGDTIRLRLSTRIRSLGGRYAVTDLQFSPSDTGLAPWTGKTTAPDWGGTLVDNPEGIGRIPVGIQIPDDSSLEGRTIAGTVTARVVFPEKTKGTPKSLLAKGVFRNRTVRIEEPLTVHIFGAKDLGRLKAIESSIRDSRRGTMHWLFLLALGFLVVSSGLHGSGAAVSCFALLLCAYVGILVGVVCVQFAEREWLEPPYRGMSGLLSLVAAIASFIVPAAATFLACWIALALTTEKLFGIKHK